MSKSETIAGRARDVMHERLMAFCAEQGSPNKAAGVLKTEGLSFQWIKGFAGGQITNPTVGKLRILERRLDEVRSQAAAA